MSDVATEPQPLPPVEESSIVWEGFTSKSGVEYSVGTLKTAEESDAANPDSNARLAGPSKEPFSVKVEWPLGDDSWKAASPEVQEKAAITQYALSNNNTGLGSWFTASRYALRFSNADTFNYFFYDETGDHYQVNTFTKGEHVVRFDSANPKIVFITGS